MLALTRMIQYMSVILQICIFGSTGTLLHSFGTKGELPGQLNSPRGLTVDNNGLIYVSDYNNGRVQIF